MALVGAAGLAGWMLDIGVLKTIHPGFATMKSSTAMLFVLVGGAIWIAGSPICRPIRASLALIVAAVGALTLVESLANTSVGIDEWLARDAAVGGEDGVPGRMAPGTAISFVLLGVALWLEAPRTAAVRQGASLVVFGIAFLALCGYLYGVSSLHATGLYASLGLNTTVAFAVASIGCLMASPRDGFMRVALSRTAAGTVVRRLVPTTALMLVVLGWIRLLGQQAGLFGLEFGLALMVSSAVAIFSSLTWLVALSLDRSERSWRRAQTELASRLELEGRATERLRLAVESAPTGVILVDFRGVIVLVNARIERLFGYERTELVGQSVDMLVPARLRAQHHGHRTAFHDNPADRPMGAGRDLYALRKDGSEVPIEIGLNSIETPEGHFVRASVVDITGRKHSEELFRALVDAAAQIVWTTDADGAVLEDSPSWRAFTGQTYEQWKGWGWLDAFHPEDRARTADLWRDAVSHKKPLTTEYRIRHISGEWRWTLVRAVPLFNTDGAVRGWVGMNTDITARKEAEEERSRLVADLETLTKELESRVEARTQALRENERQLQAAVRQQQVLLREIHHRVKNNLAVISSLFFLESQYTKNESAVKLFAESQRRVRSMALVHEALYESEDFGDVDFAEYANELARELFTAYHPLGGGVVLDAQLSPVRLSMDLAIPCGLILNELVSNALKHAFPTSHAGTITLRIDRTQTGEVVVEVCDNGVGPPAGVALDTTASLGLRLVRSLARQIRATFDLEHTNPGTRARITFSPE